MRILPGGEARYRGSWRSRLGSLNVARLMVRLGMWQVAQPMAAKRVLPRPMASFSARVSAGISPSRASSWRVVGRGWAEM